MTIEILKKIIEDNNIPNDATLMSDSGWECCETDMNGVYYNIKENIIIFTQDSNKEYNYDSNYKLLYATDYIPSFGNKKNITFWPMAKGIDIEKREFFTQSGCETWEEALKIIEKWEKEFDLSRKWIDTLDSETNTIVGREYV